MADFLVSDFLDLLYEDLRKDFISPLQVGKERWESVRPEGFQKSDNY